MGNCSRQSSPAPCTPRSVGLWLGRRYRGWSPIKTKSMNDPTETNSAIDAVRCLYLAKEAQRRGDEVTAKRWRDKALAWMARLDKDASRLDEAPPSSNSE